MGLRGARIALGVVWLPLAMLCSACAVWTTSSLATQPSSPYAAPQTAAAEAAQPMVRPPERAPLPLISSDPEDFLCLDGSTMRISYSPARDVVSVSLNGGRRIAMRRVDDAELAVYRAAGLEFRRSGPRVALASDQASVIVQRGDTLGLIALRIYGERARAMEIARLNELANPDLIIPGQVLRLPHVERRCRRSQREEASNRAGDTAAALDGLGALERRSFSPPSRRQPDQRRIRATATDPPLH
jgi:LysM repeat protein